MDPKQSPFYDPVVEEIRETRKRLWAECEWDVQKYLERLDRELPRKARAPAPPSCDAAPDGPKDR